MARNLGRKSVFIQEGLLIEGLKQSRMAIQDLLIPAGESVQLAVACVERGRWGSEESGRNLGRAPISVIAAARDGAVGESLGSERRIQQRVWSSVAQHRSRSQNLTTTSLTEVVTSYKKSSSGMRSNSQLKYKISSRQSGFVVSALGTPLLLEAFAGHPFFECQFKEIIESLFWDTSEIPHVKSSRSSVEQFLREIQDIGVNQSLDGLRLSAISPSHQSLEANQQESTLHELVINHNHPILV